ncbi:hypothetical protein HYY73_01735 [Candidatus Woesearchaeota archaeon]|nr:hypothetical protein [Candidatus Woesearchaeota archaeon]
MKRSISKEDEEIREEDIIGEVKVTIDKDAFKKPIKCCGKLTERTWKKTSYRGIEVSYDVWQCKRCHKDYLDTKQAKHLERFWQMQMFFEGKAPKMERSLNYDGKTYFVRFPKDLTAGWAKQKKEKARLTMLSPDRYLVEVA